ncbi:hypothetical protein [Geodermatophilus dictyosporus]|nr:hypothetical protein [Geodermatophilus dictyosporus]
MSDEQLTTFTEGVAAAVKTRPGFVSYQSGLDRQAGNLVAISTWQDADSANFNRDALGSIISEAIQAGIRLKPPMIYEVTATA